MPGGPRGEGRLAAHEVDDLRELEDRRRRTGPSGAVRGSPVGPVTVLERSSEPAASAASTVPSPPSAIGQDSSSTCGALSPDAAGKGVDHLGGAEGSFELVRSEQDGGRRGPRGRWSSRSRWGGRSSGSGLSVDGQTGSTGRSLARNHPARGGCVRASRTTRTVRSSSTSTDWTWRSRCESCRADSCAGGPRPRGGRTSAAGRLPRRSRRDQRVHGLRRGQGGAVCGVLQLRALQVDARHRGAHADHHEDHHEDAGGQDGHGPVGVPKSNKETHQPAARY